MTCKHLMTSSLVALATIWGMAAQAAVVEFHVKPGTGQGNWNSAEGLVHVKIGDTLRIVNDDSIVHSLHTDDGRPCEHGTDMAPHGGSYDCFIQTDYDSSAEGPLHDHYYTNALFWVTAQ